MLIVEDLYDKIKQVLIAYRKSRVPEKLVDSSVHKPLEYLNLHTSATYFVEQEMDFINSRKNSSELKKLCDLGILLEGFINYLRNQVSQRLITQLAPIRTNLWDTGNFNDLLHFTHEFANAIDNATQLISMNSSRYSQSQYQKTFFTNPLLAEAPQYRTGDTHRGQTDGKKYTIPEANMGPSYNDYLLEHQPRDQLAEFW